MLKLIKNYLLNNVVFIAIAVSLSIVFLSLVKTDSLPQPTIKVSDKLLHSLAYLGLMWSWLMVFRKELSVKKGFFLFLVLLGFGMILEFLQGVITDYRTPDVMDIIANGIGLLVGIVSFKPLLVLLKKLYGV